jgi:tellurite resistance protein TerC
VGVLITRGALIAVGAVLISRFSWTIYLFGGFLLFSAIQMLRKKDEQPDPDHNPVIRLARRLYPVAPGDHGSHFFVRINGKLAMTKLFPVLLLVESTDVVFALDSIPAIFGVTQDPFLVFTSNVFAVLGLRSLYFALAGLIREFHYLKFSLVMVLMFVAVKMLISQLLHISAGVSFGVILGILGAGIGASVLKRRRDERISTEPPHEVAGPEDSPASR